MLGGVAAFAMMLFEWVRVTVTVTVRVRVRATVRVTMRVAHAMMLFELRVVQL